MQLPLSLTFIGITFKVFHFLGQFFKTALGLSCMGLVKTTVKVSYPLSLKRFVNLRFL
jgi:hypothetical protein